LIDPLCVRSGQKIKIFINFEKEKKMKGKVQFLIVEFFRGWVLFFLVVLALVGRGISKANIKIFTLLRRLVEE
jgi:hypothetical protein